jgi:predicted permease
VNTVEMSGDTMGNRISDVSLVTPGYFTTLGIPLIAGRDIDARDVEGSPQVAVINQALADTLWPGENPIGRRFELDETVIEVIGLTPTGKYHDMRDENVAILYRPIAQEPAERYTLLARTSGNPTPLLAAIRQTLAELDPDLALERPMPMEEMIGNTLGPQRLAASLIGGFGLIGLLLAAIGLYGVVSYHVGQRTREIGIRIALGAGARAVIGMVVRHGARLATIGIAVGVIIAVAATRFMSSMLFGVSATDGTTFSIVCLLLIAVALLASWLPARRATRVDPTIALRAE